MARAIVSRLLHEPTLRLKSGPRGPRRYVHVQALRELFGLEPADRARGRPAERPPRRSPPWTSAAASARAERGRGRAPAHRHARERAGARPGGAGPPSGCGRPSRDSTSSSSRSRTSGDEGVRPAADARGDKSRFVKEIEEALLDGRARPGRALGQGRPGRAARRARDRRRARAGRRPRRAVRGGVARGARRAGRGWARARCAAAPSCWPCGPTWTSWSCAGNVDTRLRRLGRGRLRRAWSWPRRGSRGSGSRRARRWRWRDMTPAAGQGAWRSRPGRADEDVAELARGIGDLDALVRLTAERALLTALGASCQTPVGAHAELGDDGHELTLLAFVGAPDGSAWIRDAVVGSPEDPAEVGREVAQRLLLAGAGEILDAAEAARRRASSLARDGPRAGTVYLVGAGPGDPGLMTRRSLELIAGADAILYDRLIPRRRARRRAGRRRPALRRQAARAATRCRRRRSTRCSSSSGAAGLSVVRLKGGDPFVFGRGGEEAAGARRRRGAVRGRAGRDRRHRRARLRRASRSPTATTPRRWRSSPATRTRRSPRARSTGRRSPPSRARSCSTWG